MKSLSSQLIINEKAEILRNTIVQQTETELKYLDILGRNHEAANTIYYDGIISPPIISATKHGLTNLELQCYGYELILINDLKEESIIEKRKIIIDFGTEDLLIINELILKNNTKLSKFESTNFIIACTALPQLFTKKNVEISKSRILWSGTDLVTKKITAQTTVSIV